MFPWFKIETIWTLPSFQQLTVSAFVVCLLGGIPRALGICRGAVKKVKMVFIIMQLKPSHFPMYVKMVKALFIRLWLHLDFLGHLHRHPCQGQWWAIYAEEDLVQSLEIPMHEFASSLPQRFFLKLHRYHKFVRSYLSTSSKGQEPLS